MSVYSVKGKGWRYDFTLKGERYTQAWFKTKTVAKQAEAERRKEVLEPPPKVEIPTTDMGFWELVTRRLDHVKVYNSEQHYAEQRSRARRWVVEWRHLTCSEITPDMIRQFVLERRKVSSYTANKELSCLRALLNFGKKRKYITENPTDGIEFFPNGKKVYYVPPLGDIDKVMALANKDQQDYLWTIRDTVARGIEVNRLNWEEDVNFDERYVWLHTRKKKGGHLTPRKVHMTDRLFKILSRRYAERDPQKPWVFWHRYWSRKEGKWVEGPYKDRKRFMKTLCKKAGVKYFRFHPLRHAGASFMDNNNVHIGDIQNILGHEDRTTTEIYLHRLRGSERDAIAVLERVTEKSHTDSHTVAREAGGQ